MTMSTAVKDREYDKFVQTADGKTAVRIEGDLGAFGTLLQGVSYNYIGVTYPSSVQEVYTYKNGGPSGTVSAVIQINYTDSTKNNIDNVYRTT